MAILKRGKYKCKSSSFSSFQNSNFHNISLGQGQEVVAEAALDLAGTQGHWVILQNIHLVKSWLPNLEKKIEHNSLHGHEDYR